MPPFTSVADMLAQDEYRWGVNGGSKLRQVLRVSGMLSHPKKGTDDENRETIKNQPANQPTTPPKSAV